MGSEDLFHKRKAKSVKQLARTKGKRAPYDKVLIVCEGEKTEPYYFTDARNYHKINTLNIIIEGTGTDPLTLVQRAKQLYQEQERLGDPYDRVYCVFDKDEHTTYQQAVDLIKKASPKTRWFVVTSVPCFEYWLLLHFTYTTQPFYSLPDLSAAKAVVKELKKYIPDYEEGANSIYSSLIDQVKMAINYAKRASKDSVRNVTDNPSTSVHKLVEYIRTLT